MVSRPTCVTSLTATGSTLAGKPSPKRASASINGPPCAIVVQEHDGALATGIAIDGQQGAHLAHQGIGRRQRIGCRTSRTDGGALAAARTDLGVDRHVIARRRDGAGWAQIEAALAADDARSRMGAQLFGEGDIAGLLEGADKLAGLQDRLEHP